MLKAMCRSCVPLDGSSAMPSGNSSCCPDVPLGFRKRAVPPGEAASWNWLALASTT